MCDSDQREWLARQSGRLQIVVLVGEWAAAGSEPLRLGAGASHIERCPADGRALVELLARKHPAWLLIGPCLEDVVVGTLVHSALTRSPSLGLAMLGAPTDWKRCERWIRRGFLVYLADSSSLDRCMHALAISAFFGVIVIDRVFQNLTLATARLLEPVGSLTRREQEVLTWVCLGGRDADIAAQLHLSRATVEFHIRHLMTKLGARTRVDLVDRAIALGLEPRTLPETNGNP